VAPGRKGANLLSNNTTDSSCQKAVAYITRWGKPDEGKERRPKNQTSDLWEKVFSKEKPETWGEVLKRVVRKHGTMGSKE